MGRDHNPLSARSQSDSRSRLLKAPDTCIQFDPVSALPLCPVQGPIGRREKLATVAARPVLGHPEAAGDGDGRAGAAAERALCERRPDALGEVERAGRVGAGQEEQELLPAPAAGEVGVADGRAEYGREAAENVVSDRMTVAVVHGLEVVEVGEHEREGGVEPLRTGDLRAERVVAVASVREPGEAVDEGLTLDDAMQARVLESDRGMRRQRDGVQSLLGVEGRTDEEERAERRPAGAERQLENDAVRVRLAALDDPAVVGAEACTRRAGGLDASPRGRRSLADVPHVA